MILRGSADARSLASSQILPLPHRLPWQTSSGQRAYLVPFVNQKSCPGRFPDVETQNLCLSSLRPSLVAFLQSHHLCDRNISSHGGLHHQCLLLIKAHFGLWSNHQCQARVRRKSWCFFTCTFHPSFASVKKMYSNLALGHEISLQPLLVTTFLVPHIMGDATLTLTTDSPLHPTPHPRAAHAQTHEKGLESPARELHGTLFWISFVPKQLLLRAKSIQSHRTCSSIDRQDGRPSETPREDGGSPQAANECSHPSRDCLPGAQRR